MRDFMKRWLAAFNLWRCRKGRHAPLVWHGVKKKSMRGHFAKHGMNQPTEMLFASGFMSLAKTVGWCPRCGYPVEWVS